MKKLWLAALACVGTVASAAEVPLAIPQATSTTSIPTTSANTVIPFPTFNALLQAWSVDDNSPSGAPSLGFRLRRAELKVSGTVGSRARYLLMVDPAKAIRTTGDNRVLQDIGIAFKVLPEIEVMAGQFKTMTTAEGLTSSGELTFPERSLSGRTFGDRREPGLLLEWNSKPWRVRTMVSNGEGTNADATKDVKDWTSRLDVAVTRDVKVGAFAYLGDFKWEDKRAFGVNAQWARDSFSVGAEAVIGRRQGPEQLGLDVEATYRITDWLQPAVRYGLLRPIAGANATNTAQEISLGVNYFLSGNAAKLQVAGTWIDNLAGNIGSPQFKAGNRGVLLVASFQASI